jgi:hypothetical protein
MYRLLARVDRYAYAKPLSGHSSSSPVANRQVAEHIVCALSFDVSPSARENRVEQRDLFDNKLIGSNHHMIPYIVRVSHEEKHARSKDVLAGSCGSKRQRQESSPGGGESSGKAWTEEDD